MKTFLFLLPVLIFCYLCRAQKHNSSSDVSPQTVGSGEAMDQTLKPSTETEGTEQELDPRSDIAAELRELRDLVVEQRVELRHLTARVTAAESQVEELTKANIAQAAELEDTQQKLSSLQQRLTVSESHVEELEKQQEGQNAALQELHNTNAVRKVGFSASLRASGEGNAECTSLAHLVYKNVITNTGNHYSPITGYFTAPVRGVYYFSFTGHVAYGDCSMRLDLVKNGDHVVTAGDRHTTTNDAEDNATSGVVLQLEVGDVVSVRLTGNVWDDEYHRTTFSGFLLFPL